MNARRDVLRAGCVLAALAIGTARRALAGPPEFTVWCTGELKDAMTEVGKRFERSTGQVLVMRFGSAEQMRSRGSHDHPDVLMLSDDVLEAAAQKGELDRNSRATFGQVGLGIAVKAGAAAPDFGNAEALRKLLLAAKSVIHADPSSDPAGKHVAQVFARLGIADAMKARTRTAPAGELLKPVSFGDVEIAIAPQSDIVRTHGVRFAGALPADLQYWTRYGAAIMVGSGNLEEARGWLRYLAGAEAREALRGGGILPPS